MVQNHTKFRMVLIYTLEWFQCRVVPNVSGISEQIFFSVIKKKLVAQVAHPVFGLIIVGISE